MALHYIRDLFWEQPDIWVFLCYCASLRHAAYILQGHEIKGNAWMTVIQLGQWHSIILWVRAVGWLRGVSGGF